MFLIKTEEKKIQREHKSASVWFWVGENMWEIYLHEFLPGKAGVGRGERGSGNKQITNHS